MIEKYIKRTLKITFVRYAIVGGSSFVIELTTLFCIYHFGKTSRQVATALAFWVGVLMTFILQKLVAFQDYRRELKILTKQGLFYGLLVLWNYGFTIFVVSLFSGRDLLYSRTLAQIILVSWSYLIYKKVIFKDKVNMPV